MCFLVCIHFYWICLLFSTLVHMFVQCSIAFDTFFSVSPVSSAPVHVPYMKCEWTGEPNQNGNVCQTMYKWYVSILQNKLNVKYVYDVQLAKYNCICKWNYISCAIIQLYIFALALALALAHFRCAHLFLLSIIRNNEKIELIHWK